MACVQVKSVFLIKNLCNFGVVLQYCIDSISVLVSLLLILVFDVISADLANNWLIRNRK